MSALRPADGGARIFLLRVLGRAVADCGGADRLHFLHRVFDVEPDAVKRAGKLPFSFPPNFRACLSASSGRNAAGESVTR